MRWKRLKVGMERAFAQQIVDLISDMTNLSIFLYIEKNDTVVYSRGTLPDFCLAVRNVIDEGICSSLFPPNLSSERLSMCRAGLWCRTIPLEIGDGSLAYFSVGHRRIKGRDAESKKKLAELVMLYGMNRSDASSFIDKYDELDAVDEEKFYNPIFENLLVLEKQLLEEHSLIRKQEDQLNEIKYITLNFSHEFLLPIQALIANAWHLSKNLKDENDLKIAKLIMEGLIKLSFIAENIRNTHVPDIEYTNENIYEIINDAIDVFQSEANMKGIIINKIQLNDPTLTGCIEASLPDLKHLFFNLIQNAIRYSYESNTLQGYIKINIDKRNESYIIEISNYGIGILEDEVEKIFLRGYRGKLSADRHRIGCGLGLAAAKEIVERHNGQIEVESKKIGDKDADPQRTPFITKFRISLPIKHKSDYDG